MAAAGAPLVRTVDWAGLPSDLLACVFERLSVIPGRVCFRAVCRSWRAAGAQDEGEVVRMPPPWVAITEGGGYGCCDEFELLSVLTMQSFRWKPPGGARLRCVGSNGGWLAGTYIDGENKIRISLLNPLTGARIDVPATVRRISNNMPKLERDKRWFEEIALCRAVHKVAFSPHPTEQDFAVAVAMTLIPSCNPAVAFAKAGQGSPPRRKPRSWLDSCEGWCVLADLGSEGGYTRAQIDVAYHQGKFYYMTVSSEVWVVDMAAPTPSPTPFAKFAPTMPGLIYRRHHLAFTGDGALHVVCSTKLRYSFSRVEIDVQRYDPSRAEQGSSPWAPATCLRGHSFLVSDLNQTQTLTVAADGDGAWLKPDSVCAIIEDTPVYSDPSRGTWVLHLATGDIRRPTRQRREDDSAGRECANYRPPELEWMYKSGNCLWIMPSMR